jgi:hypothetical protein
MEVPAVPAYVGIEEGTRAARLSWRDGEACHGERRPDSPEPSFSRPRGEVTYLTRLATRIAAALSGIIAIVLAGGAHWKS